jgi:GNAT superfamily N-acetyltransferase
MAVDVQAAAPADRSWIGRLIADRWGDPVVSRGIAKHPAELPGFVARIDGRPVGLATYEIAGEECELVTIDALVEHSGAGTALLEAVAQAARSTGCHRLWLITTNDNLEALRFYQRRGFALVAVHRDAIAASRALKPAIPELGEHGIPIRDEIELELAL